jgi:soluble lytic murein transglycosylase
MPSFAARLPRPLVPLFLTLAWLAACVFVLPATEQQAAARTPADALAQARRLATGGEWEAAAQAYTEAMADPGEVGLTARFELARLQDQQGHDDAAVDLLGPLLARPESSPVITRGWFLLGSAQSDLGHHDAAASAYGRYVALGGPAAAYARVEQARELSASSSDPDAALTAMQPVLDGSVPLPARRRALRLAGSIEEDAGRPDQALPRYAALLTIAAGSSDRILALSRIGALNQQIGNLDAAAQAWQELITSYPSSPEAEAALDGLSAIGRPADTLAAGLVHYRRGNNQQARDLFNAYLNANGSTGPGAATALFYLGALADRRGDVDLAVENYGEAYAADPTGSLAPEALWERAGTLEGAGRIDEAQADYARVAREFPSSSRAADAAFRAGYLAYTAGRTQDAGAIWAAAIDGANDAVAARAAFWAGRAAGEAGDGATAAKDYAEAVRRDPTGYYGLRAAAVAAGDPGAPSSGPGAITVPSADWPSAEGWLASWAGAEDGGAWQAVTASEDWQAAMELLQVGWHRTGGDAVQSVIGDQSRRPWVLYRMARSLSDAGEPRLAYAAAAGLLAAAPGAVPPQANAIARLAYPAPWADQVGYYATAYGLDPFLLYALIRQESAFDPQAGSSAGAFGLTQVVSGTAQDIASALGKGSFQFGDLARPNVAIQFGAYYLAAQVKQFNGNVYEALAAYNGGAGNASRWAKAGGPADVDRFYEEIDFSETKLYLRTVLQNYAWYRYLYGAAPRPSITRAEPVVAVR